MIQLHALYLRLDFPREKQGLCFCTVTATSIGASPFRSALFEWP